MNRIVRIQQKLYYLNISLFSCKSIFNVGKNQNISECSINRLILWPSIYFIVVYHFLHCEGGKAPIRFRKRRVWRTRSRPVTESLHRDFVFCEAYILWTNFLKVFSRVKAYNFFFELLYPKVFSKYLKASFTIILCI